MSTIQITLELPEELVRDAQEKGVLKSEIVARLIQDELNRVKDEQDDEEQWVEEALGDALNPDGSIDFDKLRANGTTVTLEALYPEGDDES